jgi:ABC-2 type transport system permease protein
MSATMTAFVRRDFQNWASYRLALVGQLAGIVGMPIAVYLLGRVVGSTQPDFITTTDTDYTSFLMTTLTFMEAISVGFVLPIMFREAQSAGTLEAMMLSQFGIYRLLVYSAMFPLVMTFTKMALYGTIAVVVFGLWHGANLPAVVLVFLAALLANGAIGALSCAFVIVYKRGDPIWAAYRVLSAFVAGALFPREVLPPVLQFLGLLLPMTHALDGLRRALAGGSVAEVAPQVLIMLGMFLALLPFTIWALTWAVRRAKEEGSFVHY